jgi:O-antigen/teichoic acid export membrane protein
MDKIFNTSLIFKSGIASIDQAMLSAANFTISIILIKYASKVEYGYYSITFSVLLIFLSIQSAIVNAPLAVLLVTKKGKNRKRYAGSLCYGQFIFVIPIACLGLACIAFLNFWGLDPNKAWIATACCIAVVGLLLREFLRAYFFAEETPLRILKMDVFYTILFLSLTIITSLLFEIKTSAVLAIMGTSAFTISLLFSRTLKWGFEQQHIKASYKENWKYGKWALLGVLVTHTQNYSYLYLLGAILGSVAVAEVSASRLLLMPLALIEMGWSKVVIPHGSKLREQNQLRTLFKNQILASLVFTLGIGVYLVFLLLSVEMLKSLIFNDRYTSAFDYLPLWAVIFAVRFITLNASYGLQVTKKFHIISKVNFLTMLVTLVCTYIFIRKYEINGALTALIVGGTMLSIGLWYAFYKSVFSSLKDRQPLDLNRDLMLNHLK